MFSLVKGIEELQHSEKQMFGFQKEHGCPTQVNVKDTDWEIDERPNGLDL